MGSIRDLLITASRLNLGTASPSDRPSITKNEGSVSGVRVNLGTMVAEYDPNKLRILMATPFYDYGNGVGAVSKEISEKLREKGHIVDVLLWWPGFNNPTFMYSDRQFSLDSLEDLLIYGNQYDVVHFQNDAFSDVRNGGLSRIIQKFKAPSTMTMHALAAYATEATGVKLDPNLIHVRSQLDAFLKVDRIVILTEENRDITTRYHPEFAAKYVVINNGTNIPTNSVGIEAKARELRERYHIGNEEKVLLYMGRLSVEKGLYELAQAFPEIKKQHPNTRLIIAGKGMPTISQDMAKRLITAGLVEGKDFNFAGFVEGDEKDALYEISDFVVMPSYYEHMPMTALEAMARKKPVIITDLESITRTFELNDTNQRIALPISKKGYPNAIAQAVDYAIKHPEDIDGMVQRAYNKVLRDLNWDNVANQYVMLYRSLLDGNGRQAKRSSPSEAEFKANFQAVFESTFKGYMACLTGDYDESISLLEQALGLNPNHDLAKQRLIEAYEKSIERLRQELTVRKYDPGAISRIQFISERLRKINGEGPEISIVMPIHIGAGNGKGLGYLKEAVDSLMGQSFGKSYEAILVDDGSSADVVGFLQSNYGPQIKWIKFGEGNETYTGNADSKIKVIRREKASGGPSEPTNIGYLEALKSGSRYISRVDHDDISLPNRLKELYEHLENNPTTDMVHARHSSIDENGNPINRENPIDGWYRYCREWILGFPQSDHAYEGQYKRHDAKINSELEKSNFIHNGTAMFRANVVLRLGTDNLHPTPFHYGEDWEFWKKVSGVATLDYLNKEVYKYRQHPNNITNGGK